jgi:polyisoprenoid-binding protein YceI
MKRSRFLVTLVVLALAPRSVPAAEYLLRPEQSELVVFVFKTGFASALAHDHVVRATRFSGSISGEPSDPTTAVVRVTVPAEALAADEPEIRKKHGQAATLSDSDRREIQTTMVGETQLHAAKYPDIRFHSVSIEPRTTAEYVLTGDFTLHGTTRRVRIPVTAQLSGGVLRANGAFDFNQSDFGITPVSLFLGAVRNRDRVRIVFELVATP